eukprot:g29041.t2
MREVTYNFQQFSPDINRILNAETPSDSQQIAIALSVNISDKSVPLFASMVAAVQLYVNDQGSCDPAADMTQAGWQDLLMKTLELRKLLEQARQFYLQVGNGIDVANSQVGLVVTLNSILERVDNLVQGNKALDIPAPPTQSALTSLLSVKLQWEELQGSFSPAMTNRDGVTNVEVANINSDSVGFKSAVQQIVWQYETSAIGELTAASDATTEAATGASIHTIIVAEGQKANVVEVAVLANLVAYAERPDENSILMNTTRAMPADAREEVRSAGTSSLAEIPQFVDQVIAGYEEVKGYYNQAGIPCSNRTYNLPEWEGLVFAVGRLRALTQEASADFILSTQGVNVERSIASMIRFTAAFRSLAYGDDQLPSPPTQQAVNKILNTVKPAYDHVFNAAAASNVQNFLIQADAVASKCAEIKSMYFNEAQSSLSEFPVQRLEAALDQMYRVNRVVKLALMNIYQLTTTSNTLSQSISEFERVHKDMKEGGGGLPEIVSQREDLLAQWDAVDSAWQRLRSLLLTQSAGDVQNLLDAKMATLQDLVEIDVLAELFSVPDPGVLETFPWMFVAYGLMGPTRSSRAVGARPRGLSIAESGKVPEPLHVGPRLEPNHGRGDFKAEGHDGSPTWRRRRTAPAGLSFGLRDPQTSPRERRDGPETGGVRSFVPAARPGYVASPMVHSQTAQLSSLGVGGSFLIMAAVGGLQVLKKWRLHFVQPKGVFKGNVIASLTARLKRLQTELNCEQLVLGGEATGAEASELPVTVYPALHIFVRGRVPTEELHGRLKEVLEASLKAPLAPKSKPKPNSNLKPLKPQAAPSRAGQVPRYATPAAKPDVVPTQPPGKDPRLQAKPQAKSQPIFIDEDDWPYQLYTVMQHKDHTRYRVTTQKGESLKWSGEQTGELETTPSPSDFPLQINEETWQEPPEAPVPASSAASSPPPPPKEKPLSPCILVRGFAPSWTEAQMKSAFALYGGAARIQLSEDETSGRREARVQLKKAQNMQRAVEQLNGQEVGDGDEMEVCCLQCELQGLTKTLFADELDLQIDLKHDPTGVEVFIKNLTSEISQEEARGWLEDLNFSSLQDVKHLEESKGGAGYVRFADHKEAAKCIDVAEEMDFVASWSQSERLLAAEQSVYGFDLLTTMDTKLEEIRKDTKVKSLRMCSERHGPSEAKQLHWLAECGEEEMAESLGDGIGGARRGGFCPSRLIWWKYGEVVRACMKRKMRKESIRRAELAHLPEERPEGWAWAEGGGPGGISAKADAERCFKEAQNLEQQKDCRQAIDTILEGCKILKKVKETDKTRKNFNAEKEKGYDLLRRGDEIEGSDPAGSRKPAVARAAAQKSEVADAALSRRGASLLALSLPSAAQAEGSSSVQAAQVGLQRVVVDVGNNEGMEKELKFWTKACQMKVLSDGAGADGARSVTVGYGPETLRLKKRKGVHCGDPGVKDDGSFAIEIKVDPSVLTRKRPSLLNYSVMQPTVNALNFTQITQPDQIFDMYARVEDSGGTSLLGDARYLDCESPRGVQVRMVPREGPPSVEIVSLNIEETKYEVDEELKIPYSILLKSQSGGPKLLLCPVPDYRIKQRDRDEFVSLLMLTPNAQEVATSAEKAIEQKKKDEEEREQLLLAGKSPDDAPKKGTRADPSVEMVGSDVRINDGVGNILIVSDRSSFRSALPA